MTKAADRSNQRIAFYGGAFDPIHNAHLAVAAHALKQANLDQVVFIPSARSPLKSNRPNTSQEDRVEMLNLAIEGRTGFAMDLCELEAGGVSYTLHTARKMRARYPKAELFWILGGDQFDLLSHWFAIEELVELLNFLVILRPGASFADQLPVPGLNYSIIEAPMMDESSTDIRERLRAGETIEDAVPEAVARFIDRRALYKN